ncbi:hypothetical protein ANN_26014 [Periplaneta americana]|uniref:Uncharacterized protein n=1 Tax=Periplaneta americana TaxID=6978 RepID=A0ABQ8S515_PERAM|nr:hypothetical protein ANN_26014 [Periplaneta americana]
MERVKWTERIRNEAVWEEMGEERMMLKLIRNRKRNWLDHWLRSFCFRDKRGWCLTTNPVKRSELNPPDFTVHLDQESSTPPRDEGGGLDSYIAPTIKLSI